MYASIFILFFLVNLATPIANPSQLIFEENILPLIETNCLECHGESSPQGELNLQTFESIMKGGKSGSVISIGSSNNSLLIQKLVTQAMPLGKEKLSPEKIELFRLWIDQGALSVQYKAPVITEQQVLPIFQMRCVVCHGKRKQEGGLDLRTIESSLKGGKSGPAVVPGDPGNSLLFQRITSGEMPPSELLYQYRVRPPSNEEVKKLRLWIEAGAVSSGSNEEEYSTLPPKAYHFWSFQIPTRPPIPKVKQQTDVRNPIDSFLLRKLESRNLAYSPEAPKLKLLRRAYLDLVGIPPSAEEVRTYLNDNRSDAYEQMIERLLNSPHYGERWAQHWLDLAGYADSEGIKFSDRFRPNAWRYRDYVIRSLNEDKPYDQFLTEQLAADELVDYRAAEITPELVNLIAATGFLRLTPDPTNSPSNASLSEKMDVIHDEITVLTSSVLGLTMRCARCHDHKYDPISQRDYYQLSAILQSAYDPYDWLDPKKRYLDIALEEEKQSVIKANEFIQHQIKDLETAFEIQAQALKKQFSEEQINNFPESLQKDLRSLKSTPEEKYDPVQKYLAKQFKNLFQISNKQFSIRNSRFKKKLLKHEREVVDLKVKLIPNPSIRALFDMGGEPSPAYILHRGEANSVLKRVHPDVPLVLRKRLPAFKPIPPQTNKKTTGNRLALARWLTNSDHPLTSRVMVNRIWMHHFGRGLVSTPSNFGKTGAAPSHPKLLDWLATEFVAKNWSLKSIHRLLMTSTAYRQSSKLTIENRKDPQNILWSRMPMRRMDAEVLFDSMLAVTGRLNLKAFGPPIEVEKLPNGEIIAKEGLLGWRRAIYVQRLRLTPVTFFDLFDAPLLAPNCTERRYSTVAPQALQIMNGHMVRKLARYFAGRLIESFPQDPTKQVNHLYWSVLSRAPSTSEMKVAIQSLLNLRKEWQIQLESEYIEAPRSLRAEWSALGSLCHAILSSAEFLYID